MVCEKETGGNSYLEGRVRLRPGLKWKYESQETGPPLAPPLHTSAAWDSPIGPQGGCGDDCLPRECCVSPGPSGDSLWLSMALPALGLDPCSLLGLLLFQLLLLLPPSSAGAGGQGPVPRVRYYAGKCLMARKCGDGISQLEGDGGRSDEWREGRKTDMKKPRDMPERGPQRQRETARNRSLD